MPTRRKECIRDIDDSLEWETSIGLRAHDLTLAEPALRHSIGPDTHPKLGARDREPLGDEIVGLPVETREEAQSLRRDQAVTHRPAEPEPERNTATFTVIHRNDLIVT